MSAIVEYFDTAFTPNFHNIFTEVENEKIWRDWYYARYHNLLSSNQTAVNGLKLLENGVIPLPLFQLTSDFMASAALAQLPSYASPVPEVNAWLEENFAFIGKAIRRAGHYWSIGDTAVLAAQPGQIEAVDPIYYFRVGTPDLPDRLAGHILAIDYVWKDRDLQLMPQIELVPNRMRVVKLVNGIALEAIYEYHPHIVGRLLEGPRISPIRAICVAGGWDSWYKSVKGAAAELLTQFTIQSQALNRYANRVRFYPADVLATIQTQLDPTMPPARKQTEVMRQFNDFVYPAVGLEESKDLPRESDYSEDFQGRAAHIESCYQNFFLATGLPPRSFGIGISRYESGVAIEKSADSASVRVQGFRDELARCLPTLVRAMGCPEGEISFSWSTPPFQNREAHTQEIKDLFDRQIITLDEARRGLGYTDTDEARRILLEDARTKAANDALAKTGARGALNSG